MIDFSLGVRNRVPFPYYFYALPLENVPLTGSRSSDTFGPKMACSDVTKSPITQKFLTKSGKIFTDDVKLK